MNPHLERAMLLIEQSRHELAEEQLRQALAAEPNNATAHALLAICLSQGEQFEKATEEAHQAVYLAPDAGFPHYALSIVLSGRNRHAEAERAIQEAIALEPERSEYYAHWAQVLLNQRRWQEALTAAEEGLKLDPRDIDCTNVRAVALVRLRRKTQAADAVQAALELDPEDPITHANMGWTLLEQGQHVKAMEHFREALRLDPQLDWARQGIVEALKARYFLYRIMLSYFLWMMKLGRQTQWGIIIGLLIIYNILRRAARANPEWSPYIWPLLIAYIAFALMTWIAAPLFDLLLRLNHFGRLALSREQVITSNWVGLCIAGALLALISYFALDVEPALLGALCLGLLVPPLSKIYGCDAGWPRTCMILITVGLALLAFGSFALRMIADLLPPGDPADIAGGIGALLFLLFVLSAVASQFAANALAMVTVRK